MSEERPSAAQAPYPHLTAGDSGETGETGVDTARALIQSGIARPGEERPVFGDQPRSSPSPSTPPTRQGAAAFDASQYRPADGVELDKGMLGEFGTTAKELGISQAQGEKLLQMLK